METASVAQIAEFLGISKQAVYRWCKCGLVDTHKCEYPGTGYKHWIIVLTDRTFEQMGMCAAQLGIL